MNNIAGLHPAWITEYFVYACSSFIIALEEIALHCPPNCDVRHGRLCHVLLHCIGSLFL